MEVKKNIQTKIKIVSISILFLFIIGYAFNRTSFLSQGVDLEIENLEDGQVLQERSFVLKGVARRAVLLTINGRELFIDQEGNFEDILVLHPGLNKIVIEAYDKFDSYTYLHYTIWHETQTNTESILSHYQINKNSDTEAMLEEQTETEAVTEPVPLEESNEIETESLEIINLET